MKSLQALIEWYERITILVTKSSRFGSLFNSVFANRRRSLLVMCGGLSIAIIAITFHLTRGKPKIDPDLIVPRLETFQLKKETLVKEIEAPGTVTYFEKASVSSKILGRVESIFKDDGEAVKKGTKLAQIETFELNLRLREAQGNLHQLKAQYQLMKARYTGARREVEKRLTGMERMQSDIIDSKAGFLNAKQTLLNKKDLYDLGGVSGLDLRNAYSSYLSSASRYYQSRKDFQIQAIGFRDEDLASQGNALPTNPKRKVKAFIDLNSEVDFYSMQAAKAQYENAAIQVQNVAKMLSECTIVSPLNGVVASRNVEVGEEAKQGEPLLTVVRMDQVYVMINLPEVTFGEARVGQKVSLEIGTNGQKYEGIVRIISPVLDVKTRSGEIKVLVQNKEGVIKPGMFIRAKIKVREKPNTLGVSGKAIVRNYEEDQTTFGEVFQLNGERVFKKKIQLGEKFGEEFEVLGGLKEGDIIVTEQLSLLKDGMRVFAKGRAKP